CFFFSSRRRHTRWPRDWSSDVCSSDLGTEAEAVAKPVGSARELRQFFTADVVEEIELLRAMRETTQSGAQKAHLAPRVTMRAERSEERRVGKECRCRWTSYE